MAPGRRGPGDRVALLGGHLEGELALGVGALGGQLVVESDSAMRGDVDLLGDGRVVDDRDAVARIVPLSTACAPCSASSGLVRGERLAASGTAWPARSGWQVNRGLGRGVGLRMTSASRRACSRWSLGRDTRLQPRDGRQRRSSGAVRDCATCRASLAALTACSDTTAANDQHHRAGKTANSFDLMLMLSSRCYPHPAIGLCFTPLADRLTLQGRCHSCGATAAWRLA
jgi:hypothetical protein